MGDTSLPSSSSEVLTGGGGGGGGFVSLSSAAVPPSTSSFSPASSASVMPTGQQDPVDASPSGLGSGKDEGARGAGKEEAEEDQQEGGGSGARTRRLDVSPTTLLMSSGSPSEVSGPATALSASTDSSKAYSSSSTALRGIATQEDPLRVGGGQNDYGNPFGQRDEEENQRRTMMVETTVQTTMTTQRTREQQEEQQHPPSSTSSDSSSSQSSSSPSSATGAVDKNDTQLYLSQLSSQEHAIPRDVLQIPIMTTTATATTENSLGCTRTVSTPPPFSAGVPLASSAGAGTAESPCVAGGVQGEEGEAEYGMEAEMTAASVGGEQKVLLGDRRGAVSADVRAGGDQQQEGKEEVGVSSEEDVKMTSCSPSPSLEGMAAFCPPRAETAGVAEHMSPANTSLSQVGGDAGLVGRSGVGADDSVDASMIDREAEAGRGGGGEVDEDCGREDQEHFFDGPQ